jgi:hypothetical protein
VHTFGSTKCGKFLDIASNSAPKSQSAIKISLVLDDTAQLKKHNGNINETLDLKNFKA